VTYICCAHWSDCVFLQLILFANTAAFFCALLGLVQHSFWEGHSPEELSKRWHSASKRSITPAILGLFQETMAYKQAFHTYSAILDSFFYAYSAIVDSFMFSYETLHSATLSLTNKLGLCLFKPMFWSRYDKTMHFVMQLYTHTTFFDTPQLRFTWLTW